MQKCLILVGVAALLAVLVGCETIGGGVSVGTSVPGTGVSVRGATSTPTATPAAKSSASYKLPFSVTLGGQKAVPASAIFAKVANPVPANAELVLGVGPQQVIINAFPSDLEGKTKGAAKVIIFQKSNKGTLAQTLDKSKLAPGIYLMNIVADSKTARVLFEVK